MEIFGSLTRINNFDTFLIVFTDRYLKHTRANPSSKKTVTHIATLFLNIWIVPYGLLDFLLAVRGPQLLYTSFATFCWFPGLRHAKATAYYLETNRQFERYHKMIFPRFRHYIAEHQYSWDILRHFWPTRPVPRLIDQQVQPHLVW